MSLPPNIEEVQTDGPSFQGTPWNERSIDTDAAQNILIAYQGLPILLVGPGENPPPAPTRRASRHTFLF